MLIETLLQSAAKLLDVCVLLMFTFLVFGIISVQSFEGALKKRCINDHHIQNVGIDNFVWYDYKINSTLYGIEDSLGFYCSEEDAVTTCGTLDFYDIEESILYEYKCIMHDSIESDAR